MGGIFVPCEYGARVDSCWDCGHFVVCPNSFASSGERLNRTIAQSRGRYSWNCAWIGSLCRYSHCAIPCPDAQTAPPHVLTIPGSGVSEA